MSHRILVLPIHPAADRDATVSPVHSLYNKPLIGQDPEVNSSQHSYSLGKDLAGFGDTTVKISVIRLLADQLLKKARK